MKFISMSFRYLKNAIEADALRSNKIAFISGPRQVGKSTLAKSLVPQSNYFTWDESKFQRQWAKDPSIAISNRGAGVYALDEIHKDRQFKRKLKGLYDVDPGPIVVTGSARLDLFRKGSDSLMGRYIPYHLHPFSAGEKENPPTPKEIIEPSRPMHKWRDLSHLGGFPEPLLAGNEEKAKRWSKLRLDRLAYEDSRDLMAINDINKFRILLALLPERVGSLLSINSLREDVGAAYATVRSWVYLTEALFYCFFIRPYTKSIKRSLTQEPKFYLYDILQLDRENTGQINENLAALHLLKGCQYWTDTAQGEFELRFIRDKEKREVDFIVLREGKPYMLVECKTGEKEPAAALKHFTALLKPKYSFQLVSEANYHREYAALGITVVGYERFFSSWV